MPTVDLGLVVGSNGQGVPTGGSAGQILAKNSSSNYDTGWLPMSAAAAAAFGIVENGNAASQTIAAGQYVIWKGVLYTADAAIASGTTLAASGGNKNLTAVSNGGLNALNSKINTINSNSNQVRFSNISSAATGTIESLGVGNSTYGSYFLLMRIDSSNDGAWAGFVRHNASGYQVSEVYKGEHTQTPYVDSNGIVKTSSTTLVTVHAYYLRLSAWN